MVLQNLQCRQWENYLRKIEGEKVVGLLFVTSGEDIHRDEVLSIHIAAGLGNDLEISTAKFEEEDLVRLKQFLEDKRVKVVHHAKNVLSFLLRWNIYLAPLFDTFLAGRLLMPYSQFLNGSLSILSSFFLEEVDEPGTFEKPDPALLLRLRRTMVQRLYASGLDRVARIEFRCAAAVAHMESVGICLDQVRWDQLKVDTEAERSAALEELYAFSGRPNVQLDLWGNETSLEQNFDSNVYVLKLLNRHGIDVKATSKRNLYPYRNHPLVKALSKYRHASNALSTFLYPYPHFIDSSTGRVYPKYSQINVWGGRLSCYGPNLQQIPRDRRYRACFRARPGYLFVIADYSQIELRVAAQISGDQRMIAAYVNGDDLHSLTASLIVEKPIEKVTKEERQYAKAVNFGLIYGMGAIGLQQYAAVSYGVELTKEQAEGFYSRFFRAYKGLRNWHERLKANPPKEGRTLAGRRFRYTEQSALPILTNVPVQGTAADIMKLAMGKTVEAIRESEIHMVGSIHDEILLECPIEEAEKTAKLLQTIMEQSGRSLLDQVPVKVDVSIAEDWAGK